MAIIPTGSPLISLAAFGVSLLLLGGYVGGEMSRRSATKQEMKEIQMQHKNILAHMDSVYQSAVEREKQALEQVEMVYNTLNMLTVQEGKTRTNINETRKQIDKGREKVASTLTELKKASTQSSFIIDWADWMDNL